MAKQRIDEISGFGDDWPQDRPPSGPSKMRTQWTPGAEQPDAGANGPVPLKRNTRFDVPGPEQKPQLNYMDQSHVDQLLARIQAEESQPPHKKNEALLAELKRQALEMMKRLESKWVQDAANDLLPRIEG